MCKFKQNLATNDRDVFESRDSKCIVPDKSGQHPNVWLLDSIQWIDSPLCLECNCFRSLTYKLATLVHRCINGRAPGYLAEFCRPCVYRRPGMRSVDSGKLHVPRTPTSFGDRSFAIAGPRTWNNLPDATRDSSLSFLTFAKLLKSYLFV